MNITIPGEILTSTHMNLIVPWDILISVGGEYKIPRPIGDRFAPLWLPFGPLWLQWLPIETNWVDEK